MTQDQLDILNIIHSNPGITMPQLITTSRSKSICIAANEDRSRIQEATFRKRIVRLIQSIQDLTTPQIPLDVIEGRPKAFRLPADYKIPGSTIDVTLAMVLTFSKQFLSPVLPVNQQQQLEDYYAIAENMVKQNKHHDRYNRFVKRVGWHPEGFGNRLVQSPAAYARSDVLSKLADAVFQNQKIRIGYESRYNETETEYIVSPAGLVMRGQIIYLVALPDGKHSNYRHYHCGRIYLVEVLEAVSAIPEDFDIQSYLNRGAFEKSGYHEVEEIEVELWIEPYLRLLLEERIRGVKIFHRDGETYASFKVRPYRDFIWWLLGFGNNIIVTKPDFLVYRLKTEIAEILSYYEL